MRRPVVKIALAIFAPLLIAAGGAASLAGTWIGTSRCVDRERAPACNDERIRFVFRETVTGGGGFHLDAQKLVDGVYGTMFEIAVVRDAASGAWVHDFDTPRGQKARWTFRVRDDGALEGALLERPSNAPIREVKARRGG